MQLVQSKLKFQNYVVNRLSYATVPDFEPKEGEVYNLNPDFTRKIEVRDENEYALTLGMTLGKAASVFPL